MTFKNIPNTRHCIVSPVSIVFIYMICVSCRPVRYTVLKGKVILQVRLGRVRPKYRQLLLRENKPEPLQYKADIWTIW
jgi:hypothetical protein